MPWPLKLRFFVHVFWIYVKYQWLYVHFRYLCSSYIGYIMFSMNDELADTTMINRYGPHRWFSISYLLQCSLLFYLQDWHFAITNGFIRQVSDVELMPFNNDRVDQCIQSDYVPVLRTWRRLEITVVQSSLESCHQRLLFTVASSLLCQTAKTSE